LRTGIFGGSFNPVHIGHLALANYLCEYGEVDEVWFLVSPQNPFKQQSELLDDHTRLELVQRAVAGYSRFRASDFEFSLPRPSYTIHTLQALSAAYPEREFYLIIGADNWLSFNRWKDYDKIIEEYPIYIYPRRSYDIDERSLPANVKLCHAPIIEISSTQIRQGISEGKNMNYFIPRPVYDYIINHGLYKNKD
jgi:nicotinate-nucleotide adenylyltransferase